MAIRCFLPILQWDNYLMIYRKYYYKWITKKNMTNIVMWDCILSICRYKYKNVYYGDYSMDQYYDMNIIKVLIKRELS